MRKIFFNVAVVLFLATWSEAPRAKAPSKPGLEDELSFRIQAAIESEQKKAPSRGPSSRNQKDDIETFEGLGKGAKYWRYPVDEKLEESD